jgi:hypothetical protein
MYDPLPRVAVEVISAVACFILLKYMIKPYMVTREGRYIGLPLGFGFLGASYALSAISYAQPNFLESNLMWVQLVVRAFSFVFLAVAYYFSKKISKNSRLMWDISFSALFVLLAAFVVVSFVAPQVNLESYRTLNIFVRVLSISCLFYITIHCINENRIEPNKGSLLIVGGYILMGLSQVSILIWVINVYELAFWGSLILRLIALFTFLFVSLNLFMKKGSKS